MFYVMQSSPKLDYTLNLKLVSHFNDRVGQCVTFELDFSFMIRYPGALGRVINYSEVRKV
jgi:hypothetical protein